MMASVKCALTATVILISNVTSATAQLTGTPSELKCPVGTEAQVEGRGESFQQAVAYQSAVSSAERQIKAVCKAQGDKPNRISNSKTSIDRDLVTVVRPRRTVTKRRYIANTEITFCCIAGTTTPTTPGVTTTTTSTTTSTTRTTSTTITTTTIPSTQPTCAQGGLTSPLNFAANTYGRDWVGIAHGAKHTYCVDLKKSTSRLTLATNDRSEILRDGIRVPSQCAKFNLKVTPPSNSGLPVQVSGGAGDLTLRYFAAPGKPVPPGRYIFEIADMPGETSCLQSYLVYWQSYN